MTDDGPGPDDALRRLLLSLDDGAPPSAPIRAVRGRLQRRRRLTAVAATVTALAVGAGSATAATGLAGGDDAVVSADSPPTAHPTPTSALVLTADQQVVRDGDRVTAGGRVVAVSGRPVHLCAPSSTWHLDPQASKIDDCSGLEVRGLDLGALAQRHEQDGTVEGYAGVTGVLQGRTLLAERSATRATLPPLPTVRDRTVPCPTPVGGWPLGSEMDGMSDQRSVLYRYQAAHHDDVVDSAMLRPSSRQVVLGVLTRDAASRDAVEQALRPALGERLCVVVSRYPKSEVTQALKAVDGAARPNGFSSWGAGLDDQLQPEVSASVERVTPELAALADRYPGLVRYEPWITPAR